MQSDINTFLRFSCTSWLFLILDAKRGVTFNVSVCSNVAPGRIDNDAVFCLEADFDDLNGIQLKIMIKYVKIFSVQTTNEYMNVRLASSFMEQTANIRNSSASLFFVRLNLPIFKSRRIRFYQKSASHLDRIIT